MNAEELINAVRNIQVKDDQGTRADLVNCLANFTRTSRMSCLPGPWGNTWGRYPRVLLSRIEDPFQIIAVLWAPGSRSAIHDHENTLGAVTGILGEVRETKFKISDFGDGWVALKDSENQLLNRNFVSPISPRDGEQLHVMANETLSWAATLHVYLRSIISYQSYSLLAGDRYKYSYQKFWFDYENACREWDKASEVVPAKRKAVELPILGSCFCREVNFRLTSESVLDVNCYCSDCRRHSGAPCTPFAFFPVDSLDVTSGEMGTHRYQNDSGYTITSRFCVACGTNFSRSSTGSSHLVGVPVGSLENNSFFRPSMNVHIGSAPAFLGPDHPAAAKKRFFPPSKAA